jgi:hypothetical protein
MSWQISDTPTSRPQYSPTAVERYKPSTKDPLPPINPTIPRGKPFSFPILRMAHPLDEFLRQQLLPEAYAETLPIFRNYYALFRLKFCCCIRTLGTERARNRGDAPEDCLTARGDVYFLSIYKTDLEQWRNLPTQGQVDYLARILGKEGEPPNWWSDVVDFYGRE